MLLAQISDMHAVAAGRFFQDGVDTGVLLERTVSHLNQLLPRPDLVLATGDLVDDGSLAAYQRLRELLDGLQLPYALLPGNHDNRDHLRPYLATGQACEQEASFCSMS